MALHFYFPNHMEIFSSRFLLAWESLCLLGSGLAGIQGAYLSNALQVHWDMEGHSVSDMLPPVCVAGLFLGWSLVEASVALENRQLTTLLWLLWGSWVIRGGAALQKKNDPGSQGCLLTIFSVIKSNWATIFLSDSSIVICIFEKVTLMTKPH